MIKCGECGYENMDGLDYCDGCGAKLAAGAAAAPAAAPAAFEVKAESSGVSEIKADGPPEAGSAPTSTSDTPTGSSAPEVPKSEAPTGEIKPEAAPESAPSAPTAAAAGAPFKAKLSVVRGGRKGQEFPLEDGNNLVGRWDPETGSFPEVDLDADDPEAKI